MIKVQSADWLKNAGIVGFANILSQEYDDEIKLRKNELEFSSELLENFTQQYFKYFISGYQKVFTLFRMIEYKSVIDKFENRDFQDLSQDDVDSLNKVIKYFKDKLKGNSYKKTIDLICELNNQIFDLDVKLKELKEIKLKKNEKLPDKISEIGFQIQILKEIILFLESEQSIKYIGASNTMYNILNKSLGKVSLLNPTVKEKNMYIEFENYFVNPAIEYLNQDKKNFKYSCFSCGSKIKSADIGFGFLNQIGFDINRKTSNVWNFNYDVCLCPMCRLIYACVPAGFSYFSSKGIFVNLNTNLKKMVEINKRLLDNIYGESEEKSLYGALIQGMNEDFYQSEQYELQDVQVVRYENDKYSFNIMNKAFLNVIKNRANSLNHIKERSWKEGNIQTYLYDESITQLLNGRNLFLLIHTLIQNLVSNKKDIFYRMNHVYSVIKINNDYLQEVGALNNSDKGKNNINYLAKAREKGHNLQIAYGGFDKDGKYNKKLNSLAYKMLNALKTNNPTSFMDTLINSYMYVEKPIPSLFSEFLDNNLMFKNIGYAFLTGMLGEKWNNDNAVDSGEANK